MIWYDMIVGISRMQDTIFMKLINRQSYCGMSSIKRRIIPDDIRKCIYHLSVVFIWIDLSIYILLNEHDNDDLTEQLPIQWNNCQFMTNNQDISV